MITHADIIPLIGGMTIGSHRAFGSAPEYFMSYEAFWANDSHVVQHYGGVPYHVLDKGERHPKSVDVVSSTCPCAGLSMMHSSYGADHQANQWMPRAAEYVLGEVKPLVYWGENAPNFAGKVGKPIRDELYRIGRSHGYSMSIFKTKSLDHGVPQVRSRSFYFFWKGDRVPVLNSFNTPHQKIEDLIAGVTSNSQREVINSSTPSKDPWYRYVLEVIRGGMSHREHSASIEPSSARGNDVFSFIEKSGHSYHQVAEWMSANGFDREAAACVRKQDKLDGGGSIMRRGVIVPKDFIGAFVGHYPTMLTHPVQDRFIDYREAMTIMGLPSDFEMINPNKKNANHICQNVPVKTAEDMAGEVKAVLEEKREWIDSTYMLQHNGSDVPTFWDEKKETSLEEFFA